MLPSPSASPYHVAVAGRHSMSTAAALPFFAADFPPSNKNVPYAAGAATSRMQSKKKKRAAEHEEAIAIGGLVPFPCSPFPIVLVLGSVAAAWSVGSLLLGALPPFYGFEKIPDPNAFTASFAAGFAALYKWQHGRTGSGMGSERVSGVDCGVEWSGGLIL